MAPKVVSDPVYGLIDVRSVLPIIETEEFQRLRDTRQLGMSYLTFPSATHSRMAHCLGSYHASREPANSWVEFGLINQEEADAMPVLALIHDIGHPVFSHVTEDLCQVPEEYADLGLDVNDALSLSIMKNLKDRIEACDVNFRLLERMMRHEHPLYLAVHDKNLGIEKLDYLERDGLVTIQSRPPGIGYLRRHIYFINGVLAVDPKVVGEAIDAQRFYMKMYKEVYLRKPSGIAQRMLQKIVYHAILAEELAPEDLPLLTDSELIGILRLSKDPRIQKLYAALRRRELFREAVVIRPEQFAGSQSSSRKAVAVFGVSKAEMEKLTSAPILNQKNQEGLESLEAKIAAIAGLPEDDVLLVPVFSPRRFEARDIMIYSADGPLESLKAKRPAHFEEMRETAQSYLALRICTTEKYRKTLSEEGLAQEIFNLVVKTATS